MDEYLGLVIAAFIGSLPGIVALIVQSKKRSAEIDYVEAGAAESYATATKTYADEVLRLRKEVESLRVGLCEAKEQLKVQEGEIQELRDWAERLVHQVKSLGAVPVEIRKAKRLRNNECG